MSVQVRRVTDVLRRIGLDGSDAFYAVAYAFAVGSRDVETIVAKGHAAYCRAMCDDEGVEVLNTLVGEDPAGTSLPVVYQHLLGTRYRRNSGKFFTPRSVASSMARMIPATPSAVVMDPSCGGGTFLIEASHRFGDMPCTLVGNDVDALLVDLTALRLAIDPRRRDFFVTSENLFDNHSLARWSGEVDCILANPPFSVRVSDPEASSPLFDLGYRTSDALFLDHAHRMMRPGGRLVCLLSHSLIANAEYAPFRAAVERVWQLRAVVTLPEGVFNVTADTSTRAAIVALDKLPAARRHRVVMSHCASVGEALDNRGRARGDDELRDLAGRADVRVALGVTR